MPESQGVSKAAASPVKLVLAVVLTVVFIVVLIVQFGGAADAEPAPRGTAPGEAPRRIARPAGRPKTRQGRPDPETTAALPPGWPATRIEDALRHDPFKVPPAFKPSKDAAAVKAARGSAEEALAREQQRMKQQAQRDRALQDLRQQGVKALLGVGSEGGVAVVGSRVVHVGDELDGFRVVAIDPDGVVLEQVPVE